MGKKGLKEKRDETIRQILDAATEVFADAGFAGARMDEIARRAGVNKAMIYYRIGDKEALYTKVLHEVFGAAAESISKSIKEEHTPEEKMRTYITSLANTMERHPSMPYIIMREMAARGRQLNEVIAKDLLSILDIVRKIIDEGVKRGAFIRTNPLTIHLMIIGVMVLFKASTPMREIFSSLLRDKFKGLDKGSFNALVQELEEMVLRAVRV
jgi:TetR/AcrR family transcriptional regulator